MKEDPPLTLLNYSSVWTEQRRQAMWSEWMKASLTVVPFGIHSNHRGMTWEGMGGLNRYTLWVDGVCVPVHVWRSQVDIEIFSWIALHLIF